LTGPEAEVLLDERPLVAATSGSIAEMKALRDRCLEVGIPALIGDPPGAGTGCGTGCGKGKGCGTRTYLLVEAARVPDLRELLHGDWRAHLEREGLAPVELDLSSDELPCPACGTAAPLVDGACSDCGLHLE